MVASEHGVYRGIVDCPPVPRHRGYLEAEGRSKTVVVVMAAVFVLMWTAVIAFLIFDRVIVGGD